MAKKLAVVVLNGLLQEVAVSEDEFGAYVNVNGQWFDVTADGFKDGNIHTNNVKQPVLSVKYWISGFKPSSSTYQLEEIETVSGCKVKTVYTICSETKALVSKEIKFESGRDVLNFALEQLASKVKENPIEYIRSLKVRFDRARAYGNKHEMDMVENMEEDLFEHIYSIASKIGADANELYNQILDVVYH